MGKWHTVVQGEYLKKIAEQYGFRQWKTIYNAGENSDFRRKRPNPNVIYPGDRIYIPDKIAKEEAAQTGASHRFVIKGAPLKLRLVLRDPGGEPLDKEPYELTFSVAGEKQTPIKARTSGAGVLEHPLPAN